MGKGGQAKPGGSGTGSGSSGEKVAGARRFLENGRFREAIESYKSLLSGERRPEWVEGLAEAYAGHAGNLAEKGMVEEALVVWQNRSRICGKPLAEGPWFTWVLRKKNGGRELVDQIGRMGRFSETDPGAAKNLAWLLFFLADDLFSAIRSPDPQIESCRLAREAWSHYGRGEREKAEELAGKIPFRSPYAPVRLLLKALVHVPHSPGEAEGFLSRIPSTPLDLVVEAARIAILPRHRQFSALSGASGEAARHLALEMLGYSREKADFVLALLRPENRSPGALYQTVLRFRSLFPPASLTLLVPRLLIHLGGSGLSEITRVLADQPEWIRQMTLARFFEEQGEARKAEEAWVSAANSLDLASGATAAKEVGAIYRYLGLGMILAKSGGAIPPLDEKRANWLKKSLKYEPFHRETLVRLVGWALKNGKKNEAGALLREGLAAHPDDPELLRLRIRELLERKDPEELSRTADRLFLSDPQNTESRKMALTGWHAAFRAHIGKGRFEKAGKILVRARGVGGASYDLAERTQELLLGILEGKSPPGALESFLADGKNRLAAYLSFDLEIRSAGLDRGAIFRKAKASRVAPDLSPRDLLDFSPRAGDFLLLYDREAILEALSGVAPKAKKASVSGLSPAEAASVCEAFLGLADGETAHSLARAALRNHRGAPRLVFAEIRASLLRSGETISPDQIRKLSMACDKAEKVGDQECVRKIDQWLEEQEALLGENFLDDEDDEEDLEAEDVIAELFGEDLEENLGLEDVKRAVDAMLEELNPEDIFGLDGPRPPREMVDSVRRSIPVIEGFLNAGVYGPVLEMMKTIFGEELYRGFERNAQGDEKGIVLGGLALMHLMLRVEEDLGEGKKGKNKKRKRRR